MPRFLADEDFNGRIVRGLFLQHAELDLVRVQDVGLGGAADGAILQWAASEGRIVLTHDGRSMPGHVREHLAAGRPLPGVFIVDDLASIGACIADLVLVAEASGDPDWQDRILYLPFA